MRRVVFVTRHRRRLRRFDLSPRCSPFRLLLRWLLSVYRQIWIFLLCLCSLFLTYFFVVVRQMKTISTQILSNAKMAPNLSLKIVSTTTSAIVSMAPMSLVLTCYSTPLILDSRELRWDFNSCPDKDFWVELIESFYIYRLQFWKKCVFWDAKLVSFWISSAV